MEEKQKSNQSGLFQSAYNTGEKPQREKKTQDEEEEERVCKCLPNFSIKPLR